MQMSSPSSQWLDFTNRLRYPNLLSLFNMSFADMDENISETKVIPHEMTLVETWFVNDKLNRDFLLQVQEKEDVKKRSYTGKSLARNVVMLVLEEVSAAHFERKLSQSFKYFTDNMKGTVFVKHGVMSLQSENNLWGILQGM